MVLCRHKWVLPTKQKLNNNSVTILYLAEVMWSCPNSSMVQNDPNLWAKQNCIFYHFFFHIDSVLLLLSWFIKGHTLFDKQLQYNQLQYNQLDFYWKFSTLNIGRHFYNRHAESTVSVFCVIFVNNRDSKRAQKWVHNTGIHISHKNLFTTILCCSYRPYSLKRSKPEIISWTLFIRWPFSVWYPMK